MGLIVIGIIFSIISFAVGAKLRNKFKKYSQIPLRSNMSGAEAAAQMLRDNGIYDVEIISTPGELTDHYNPGNKTVNLSEAVYHGRSAASVAVATHECGHAVQHAKAYAPLKLRSALVPVQSVSGRILNFIVIASIFGGGFFLNVGYQPILLVVFGCYLVITLFSLVTLPVEFDASKRALAWIDRQGVVSSQEHSMAKDALKWAAMTYVVAAIGAFAQLAYLAMALFGGRD
ncbi:zinc metallopeptidase [Roseivirga sp. BDSF3-8]|uniref:zinc metallopeptidase n=1 Tax=Roseivirga sp. BDSF3-8 TaxID=3241598 RepID=UPI0035326E86